MSYQIEVESDEYPGSWSDATWLRGGGYCANEAAADGLVAAERKSPGHHRRMRIVTVIKTWPETFTPPAKT